MVTKDNSSPPKSFDFPRFLAAPIEVLVHSLSVSIQQTVRDFRSGCSEWEDDVRLLFDDVDHFLATDKRADAGLETTISATVVEDVAGLKGLVEQQTEVLTALVNALTGPSAVADSVSERDEGAFDQFVSEVDPFERLQQVVAAASGAS